MEFKRSAGILLHPTSLPGPYGIGDLGENAYKFADFLREAGQTLWQVFPLGPTGYGDSPYQCFSAFAGNPLLISPDLLAEEGLLSKADLEQKPEFNLYKINYGKVIDFKKSLLKKAYEKYISNGKIFNKECGKFCSENEFWLEDFATFMALKDFHGGVQWSEWEKEFAFRKEPALTEWKNKHQKEIDYYRFTQYLFFKQWKKLKDYTNGQGIKIIGDLPIFVAYDSSDVWANKALFSVDEKTGKLETVAGVPPDYFSPTGQLWGNPLYRWDKMEKNNFRWWKQRMKKMYQLVDIVRIDHFRGFDAYWEIPGDAETAVNGKWVKAPGKKLFTEIMNEFGDVPILAEDLGVITESVEELRDSFGFPGMKILQFAFGPAGDKNFLPHNYVRNCVVYTGSHDNDTTRGFFEKEKEKKSGIYEWTQKYLNYDGDNICFALIHLAYSSVANIVIIPMQDILNLGSEARMNFPGKPDGNWQWRFTWEQIHPEVTNIYKEMTEIFERPPQAKRKFDEIEVTENKEVKND